MGKHAAERSFGSHQQSECVYQLYTDRDRNHGNARAEHGHGAERHEAEHDNVQASHTKEDASRDAARRDAAR